MPHKSDSAAQREAENTMLASLAEKLGLDFSARPDLIKKLKGIKPDGIDWDSRVLVEAYARVGKLKGGQPHKVKGDILKLLFLERSLGGKWRKILCFGDKDAARSLAESSRAWIGAAASEFGVEVQVVAHSDETIEKIRAAQHLQRMVNSDDA